jgi:uncharacterized protein YukE
MSQGFDVESKALRAYARGTKSDIERIEKIRSKISQLDLPSGTFGKLPQSDELKSDYDEKQRKSMKDLRDAGDTLEDIIEAIKDTADAYDRNEDAVAEEFKGH